MRLINRPALLALTAAAILAVPSRAHADILLGDIAMDANAGGFVLTGASAYDYSGRSVSGAGDVNGDGLDDFIIGAYGAGDAGTSYVVFGRSGGTSVALADIAMNENDGGFAIYGATAGDGAGFSVSGAGDVNGDGLGDLVIGANYESTNGQWAGAVYVVFGKQDGTAVQLSDIAMDANAGGYVIYGAGAFNRAGRPVSGGGDVNGDGLADVLIGTLGINSSHVVFGKADGASLQLSDITMDANGGGFTMVGAAGDNSGDVLSNAGDVNGDGLADIVIGADGATPNGANSGRAYVVFGKTSGVAVQLLDVISDLNTEGFALNGPAGNRAGISVAGAGDVNRDGLADVIVGATDADSYAGRSYVVFGQSSGTAIELFTLENEQNGDGFVIYGEAAFDWLGSSVAGGRDVNGDSYSDVLVGAPTINPELRSSHGGIGNCYVVFGKPDGASIDLASVDLETYDLGFTLVAAAADDGLGERTGSNAITGDVDGDGLPDVLAGAENSTSYAGASYLVFSPETPDAYSIYLGYVIEGDGPGGAVVPELSLPDARMRIDYSDDDFGETSDGGTGPSLVDARIYRSNSLVNNASPVLADVAWFLVNHRQNFDSVEVTLKYTESEAAPILGEGVSPALFTATSFDGPWTLTDATHDPDRNEFSVQFNSGDLAQIQYFAIGMGTDTVWANFGHDGTEIGTRSDPFDTLQEAIDEVDSGGTVKLDGAGSVTNEPGPHILSKPMSIEAVDGTVTIGAP